MIYVTGRTFDHRHELGNLGGWFNRSKQRWEFARLNDANLARLRGMVGLVVNIVDDPSPSLTNVIEDMISDLINNPTYVDAGSTGRIYGDDPTYHNHFAPRNPCAFFGFSSLRAFTDYIADIPNRVPNATNRNGWEKGRASFNGTETMRDAIVLARDGWAEGAEKAADLIDQLYVDRPEVRRRKPSMVGGSVSVGRMLAGDPMHMIKRVKQPGQKIFTFFVEAGCSAGIKPETMITRAAIVGAIVDLMEHQGYSCNIVATDTSLDNHGKPVYQLAVTIKESGERLSIADAIFALGHPSFLRRFGFAATSSAIECRSIWEDMGAPANAFTRSHPCRSNEFYVPVLLRNMKEDESLFDFVKLIEPKGLPIEIKEHERWKA